MTMPDQLQRVAEEWVTARDVIAEVLIQYAHVTEARGRRLAEAIIARLAANKPPILLEIEKRKDN